MVISWFPSFVCIGAMRVRIKTTAFSSRVHVFAIRRSGRIRGNQPRCFLREIGRRNIILPADREAFARRARRNLCTASKSVRVCVARHYACRVSVPINLASRIRHSAASYNSAAGRDRQKNPSASGRFRIWDSPVPSRFQSAAFGLLALSVSLSLSLSRANGNTREPG